MSYGQIDFADSDEFINGVAWVNDPNPELAVGCALRHIYLKQIESDRASVTGYCLGDAWLVRYISNVGVKEEEFLFDPKDFLSRTKSSSAFSKAALLVKKNKAGNMQISAVIAESGTSLGRINIPCYTGEAEDFKINCPQAMHAVSIRGHQLIKALSGINSFSSLSGDKENRLIHLKVIGDNSLNSKVEIYGPEPDGANGAAFVLAVIETCCNTESFVFNIWGRHLKKIIDLSYGNDVDIYLDSLEEPTRATFVSKDGLIDIPVYESYQARHLTQLGYYYFNPNEVYNYETKAIRIFDLELLTDCLEVQKPKSDATRRDILLSFKDNQLTISKQSDVTKSERSNLVVDSNGLDDLTIEWQDIIVNYEYLESALKTLGKHCKNIKEQTEERTSNLVCLKQIYVDKTDRWALFIYSYHEEFYDLRFALNALKAEHCADYNEED